MTGAHLALPDVPPDDETAVERAIRATRAFKRAAERDPLERFCGTPPQLALWQCPSKRRLLRGGNQVTRKTTAGCVEALWWCTHRHPYRKTPSRPVVVLFVCVAWQQSLAIQKKLWDLCPKDALRPGQTWDDQHGLGTKSPCLVFADGSVIWIRTENQGAKNMAGWTVDLIVYDEPPKSRRIYSELERRLTATNGDFVITMTPINAKIDWVREECEAGRMTDLHFRCTPEMFVLPDGTVTTVPGDDGPIPQDAAWIATQRKSVPHYEEPVTIDGEWECRSQGRVFRAWDASRMRIPGLMDSAVGPKGKRGWYLLGIDYGDDRLRTAAVLVWVSEVADPKDQPAVHVLAEYVPEVSTTVGDDAKGILAMLASRGLSWHHLAGAFGDKRYTDAAGKLTKKSNAMLEAAISSELGQGGRKTSPPVHSAKRGEGAGAHAVWASVRWMDRSMLTPRHFFVDASCVRFIEALDDWDGTERHPRKDVLDGVRYATKPFWSATNLRPGQRKPARSLTLLPG